MTYNVKTALEFMDIRIQKLENAVSELQGLVSNLDDEIEPSTDREETLFQMFCRLETKMENLEVSIVQIKYDMASDKEVIKFFKSFKKDVKRLSSKIAKTYKMTMKHEEFLVDNFCCENCKKSEVSEDSVSD